MSECSDARAAHAADSLAQKVMALPEIYQPIFAHPEFSSQALRSCEDRLESIMQIYEPLQAKLGRPLRVLDLGCAQGYFSLSLAQKGAKVVGVDFLDANIVLCKALAAEHPVCEVIFETGMAEEKIVQMAAGYFDLVLGFSLFHHMVYHRGIDAVQKVLALLAVKTTAAVFEMALASEPLYWAAAQPQNPRQLLSGYAFVHEFARHKSHLSDTGRPLYVASNHYWFLNGQAEAFHAWKIGSYEFTEGTNNGTRRYFFGQGHIVKLFTLDDADHHEANLREHINESSFLSAPPAGFETPPLFLYGRHQREAWLARAFIEGDLLFDKIRQKQNYNAGTIISDVLSQLTVLESAALFHDDLRPWNILVEPDGRAVVIDYGAISRAKKDGGWPYDLFLSFLIFMHNVLHGEITLSNPVRAEAFNPDNFPAPYNNVLWKFLEHGPEQWSFALLREALSQPDETVIPETTRQSFAALLRAADNAGKIHLVTAVHWRKQAEETGKKT